MQKDTPTPPSEPWNDDSAIPDVLDPDFMTPKPGEDLDPPSGAPTKQ